MFSIGYMYMYVHTYTYTRAKFSTASDVWSYGVVLWEIYSLGKIPWDRLSPIEIRDLLLRRERLARPDRCPLDMYEVMLECWEPTAQDKPTFGVLVQRVETVSACYIAIWIP
jgi:serine/threonine protein kinase